jgi:hypothetical protein
MLPRTLGVSKMETKTLVVRPSELILDRVLNPAGDADLNRAQPAHLLEACGIIPDFFAEACITAETENPDGVNIDAIADAMDRVYQFGGFEFPLGGDLDADGVYRSQYAEDPDMSPLVRFAYAVTMGGQAFECFVYECGITAIRERGSETAKVARFD